MKLTNSQEEYIKTIYILSKTEKEIRVTDIAKRLGITKPSVNRAIKNLKDLNLLNYQTYGEIKLTKEGEIQAQEILKKEDIVKKYARKKEIYKISDIRKKFAVITVDAKCTKKCILASQNIQRKKDVEYLFNIPIEKAVHASMAFPAIFTPCHYKKYYFIDGGTVDNLPVDALKDLGATKTISLSFKLDEYKGNENLFSTILRACDIFSLKDVKMGQKLSDIDIEIDIDQAKLLKIDNIDSSIQIGYDTVMKNKEKILGMVETK